MIAITSTFSLVFGFSDKAKKHADLAKRYKLLLADIYIQHIDELTQPLINSWQEAFYRIEAEEPPSLGALVIICQNELAAASSGKLLEIAQRRWFPDQLSLCSAQTGTESAVG